MSDSLEHRLQEAVGRVEFKTIKKEINRAIDVGLRQDRAYDIFLNWLDDTNVFSEKHVDRINDRVLDAYNTLSETGVPDYKAKELALHEGYLHHYVRIAEESEIKDMGDIYGTSEY